MVSHELDWIRGKAELQRPVSSHYKFSGHLQGGKRNHMHHDIFTQMVICIMMLWCMWCHDDLSSMPVQVWTGPLAEAALRVWSLMQFQLKVQCKVKKNSPVQTGGGNVTWKMALQKNWSQWLLQRTKTWQVDQLLKQGDDLRSLANAPDSCSSQGDCKSVVASGFRAVGAMMQDAICSDTGRHL